MCMGISPEAVERLRDILRENMRTDTAGIRVSTSKRPSVDEYKLEIVSTDEVTEHDQVIRFAGLTIYIDPVSRIKLENLILYYDTALLKSGFRLSQKPLKSDGDLPMSEVKAA